MRILVTIPHYFKPAASDSPSHGSLAKDAIPRLRAFSGCINSLHFLFAGRQCVMDIVRRRAQPANADGAGEVDVVICTTRGCELLSELPVNKDFYRQHATDAEPLLLGFECQAVLRDHLGRYDYYCYVEDDLILHDPWFFHKLAWFNRQVGDQRLLQPNRFEVGPHPVVRRAYIDGDLLPALTEPFQDVRQSRRVVSTILDRQVVFQRTLNPHSGCYFLNARQMEHWVSQPYFLDRDTSFIGPLETRLRSASCGHSPSTSPMPKAPPSWRSNITAPRSCPLIQTAGQDLSNSPDKAVQDS